MRVDRSDFAAFVSLWLFIKFTLRAIMSASLSSSYYDYFLGGDTCEDPICYWAESLVAVDIVVLFFDLLLKASFIFSDLTETGDMISEL